MADTTLTCPSCQATLRPKTQLAPGTRIKCPKCLNVFAVPGEEEEGEVLDPVPRSTRPRAAARREEPDDLAETGDVVDDEGADDEPEEDRPARRRKKPKKKSGVPVWVWVTSGVVGVIFLLCL